MLVASAGMSGWRRWCSRWSGAEAALVLAWGGFAAGLLAVALARSSAGIAALRILRVADERRVDRTDPAVTRR
jgi:hypothetical protein